MSMKKIKNKILKKHKTPQKFKKMFIYIIISNYGYDQIIAKNLRELGSNAQLFCFGQGSARKEVLSTLGFGSSNKNITFAFVDESNVKNIKKWLEKYFAENKRVMGIGFTIPVTSIVGEKIYHFLTNTI